jgi:hypothetical protein
MWPNESRRFDVSSFITVNRTMVVHSESCPRHRCSESDKKRYMTHATRGINHPSSAHISSSSLSLAACAARGMSDIGPRCRSSCASNTTALRGRAAWRPSLSSSERSKSISRLTPARRAADKSIGFGRANIDWPDLYISLSEVIEPS